MSKRLREEKMGPQARGAKVTLLLFMAAQTGNGLTTQQIMQKLGYETAEGVQYLMDNVSLADVPVYFDEQTDVWRLLQ